MKLDIKVIKKFLIDIESGKIQLADTSIVSKIKQFYSKDLLSDKQKLIEKIKEFGIGGPDTPWELESLDELKKLYKQLTR
jgi:hypothetical protein